MNNKGKFEYSATTDNAQVADYLNRIAEGLRVGTLSMAAATRTINLAPNGVFKLEIEADSNKGKGRGSIVVEISWKTAAEIPHRELEISTQLHEEEEIPEPTASDTAEA
jgi:amphi-Trp domain-containing protein